MRACALNPPPPSWGKTACQTKNSNPNLIPNSFPNLQVLEPPIVPHWPRAFRRASENFAFWTTLALKCRLLFDFLPIENSSKIRHPKRQPKISKCRPLGAQGSIFESFWEPFRHRFSIKFRKRPKLIFCNRYQLILLFWHSKASHFGIKNQPKFHVFSGMVFGTPFSHFFKILCRKG